MWNEEATRLNWEASLKKLQPPDNAQALKDRYGAQWMLEEKRLAMQAAWVAETLGGEIVEE